MNIPKVDYHIHTTFSDGKSKPEQIVTLAKELGYDLIAITDHDNVDGVPGALDAGKAVGLEVIPGIEIAAETEEGIGLHILGYEINYQDKAFHDFLEGLITARKERNKELFGVLQNLGFDISEDDIPEGKNGFIGKPNIARQLYNKGYLKSESEAFGEKVFGSEACRMVRKCKPEAKRAIEAIHAAGGIAVLAHPIQARGIGRPGSDKFFKNIDNIIGDLKAAGLDGLEVFHPDQGEKESQSFFEIARKYDLFVTRGSDFHGEDFRFADKTADYKYTGERFRVLCFSAE